MKNNTDDIIKFNWNLGTIEELSIKPRQGHINAKGTKAIHLTLKGEKTNILNGQVINCETKKITQDGDKFIEWDDGRQRRRQVTATEYNWVMKCREEEERYRVDEIELTKKGKKMTKKKEDYMPAKPVIPATEKDDIELEEAIPEPNNTVLPNTEKAIPNKVFAKIDAIRYECDCTEMYFRATMMYTARTFSFKVKNLSAINLNYGWRFKHPETDAPDTGFYTISPKSGLIRPDTEETFEVKFLPTEIEDRMDRILECMIPNLDESCPPLVIDVDSESERPICHFELPCTSYLESRGTDLSNLNFDISKLKVIEFESLGVKVRNTKRFYVVNPTATGYDFEWKKMESDS